MKNLQWRDRSPWHCVECRRLDDERKAFLECKRPGESWSPSLVVTFAVFTSQVTTNQKYIRKAKMDVNLPWKSSILNIFRQSSTVCFGTKRKTVVHSELCYEAQSRNMSRYLVGQSAKRHLSWVDDNQVQVIDSFSWGIPSRSWSGIDFYRSNGLRWPWRIPITHPLIFERRHILISVR
jgi:hypothetical protein